MEKSSTVYSFDDKHACVLNVHCQRERSSKSGINDYCIVSPLPPLFFFIGIMLIHKHYCLYGNKERHASQIEQETLSAEAERGTAY